MQLILSPVQDTLDRIESAIASNRHAAGDLCAAVLDGNLDAGKRLNQLNEALGSLEEARASVTGERLAPYRMGR